jgi:SM-20-related protein
MFLQSQKKTFLSSSSINSYGTHECIQDITRMLFLHVPGTGRRSAVSHIRNRNQNQKQNTMGVGPGFSQLFLLLLFQTAQSWLSSSKLYGPTESIQRASTPSFSSSIVNSRLFGVSTSVPGIATDIPRLEPRHLRELSENQYVVICDFLPESLQTALRQDVQDLRQAEKFTVAKIRQDATNKLNTNIRVAESCFLGPTKLKTFPSAYRDQLYVILDQVKADLNSHFGKPLDSQLTELLYAFYPQGGFYRRHRDAIPGSASTLREYSLLLYLNKDWNEQDGGQLRLHFDSGDDELPAGEEAQFRDVLPQSGTLVLFRSNAIPHEVLDTQKERVAIIGWYNRPVASTDIGELASVDLNPTRVALMGVAASLITVGVGMLISAS